MRVNFYESLDEKNMLKVIKTEEEYELALEKAYLLMQEDIEINTAQADELDLLTLLIEHYEEAHYAITPPSLTKAFKKT